MPIRKDGRWVHVDGSLINSEQISNALRRAMETNQVKAEALLPDTPEYKQAQLDNACLENLLDSMRSMRARHEGGKW